ncbi:MAG: peptide-methionine (S)-S-oxide reductase MsrA [Bacteroidota bacterium]|nr:peptide-methionine (S)-S-oxide reductase MsrA [Candidatus Kapabacteria bacterium]MDW8218932.1 peptide-methionine (S)-S-oxide reductase MsrA [Bacteroidota bacterium]
MKRGTGVVGVETLVLVGGVYLIMCSALSCVAQSNKQEQNVSSKERTIPVFTVQEPASGQTELATFGSGCFWCTEAIFQRVKGVLKVVSGYSGGTVANPTYKQVCEGTTGHAECVQITYDPTQIRYEDLLKIFWKTHDPTTPNRQGNDVGTQYRSVIFYHSEQQKALAERYKKELDASGAWDKPIVTQIVPMTAFYPAEEYHQNYFHNNPNQGYCMFVIRPKVEKFEAVFKDKLKH